MGRMKKEVLRKCAGCGEMKDRQELVRIVRCAEGEVVIDETQKRNGRGAYVCRSAGCVEKAAKRRSLERALKCGVDRKIYDSLMEMTEATQ